MASESEGTGTGIIPPFRVPLGRVAGMSGM